MVITLSGPVYTWDLAGEPRKYFVQTVPYSLAKEVFKPDYYRASTGHGEQRPEVLAHVKNLTKSMLAGEYTPTVVAVGLRPSHHKFLKIDKFQAHDANNNQVAFPTASLTIDKNQSSPLPLLDGGQRFFALGRIYKEATPEQQAKIDGLPITVTIYLDGSTKQDFLNLQLGKPVDPSHMLSLKVQQGNVKKADLPYYRLAMEVAKALTSDAGGPFHKQIRFDANGSGYPIKSLCARGGSDIATSFMGMAKVATHTDPKNQMSADTLATVLREGFERLQSKAANLLSPGKVLTPPPDGTRGAATMFIGLGTLLAYRMIVNGDDAEVILDKFVEAAKKTLYVEVDGNFSGPYKRRLIGAFAKEFLQGLDVEYHEGLPQPLLRILSTSTFAVTKLTRKKKPTIRKAANSEPAIVGISEVEATSKDVEKFNEVANENSAALAEMKVDDPTKDDQVFEPEVVGASVSEKAPWEEVTA